MARQRTIFLKQKSRSSPYRILVWMGCILVGFMLYRSIRIDHTIKPLFSPTPTPTRTVNSYQQEADTYFKTGDLEKAITSYKAVIDQNPKNTALLAQVARIEVYSSKGKPTDQEQLDRLNEALADVNQAIQINPDDSMAHAVKALVLDWQASNGLTTKEQASTLLDQAYEEATRATTLDPNNAEALAYSAEILADQMQTVRSEEVIKQALARDPNSMDVHRIYGYVLTFTAEYDQAIVEYQKAAAIYPNLTFLYIEIGLLYRVLWGKTQVVDSASSILKDTYFQNATAAFTLASRINNNINVKDPIPYEALARSLAQRGDMGDFFEAQLNMKKALLFNPTNADVYGQLGVIYQQSRNYEGAIETFKCAVDGCTGAESCSVRQDCDTNKNIEIKGLPLTSSTLVYYYSYGSVLAGMSKPTNQYCEMAANVFDRLKKHPEFGKDANVMGIVRAGESICGSEESSPATGTPGAGSPTGSPTAAGTANPLPSLVPTATKGVGQ